MLAVGVLGLSPTPAPAVAPVDPAATSAGSDVGCRLIGPTDADALPVSGPLGECTGVRPGSLISGSPSPGGCTMNFLFEGGDGYRYVGTAGHCVAGGPPQAWAPGTGPAAYSRGARIGEFAYSVLDGPYDFALARLDPGVPADPEMCHFGGPTGLLSDGALFPTTVRHYGNGAGLGVPVIPFAVDVPIPFGVLTPARSGVAVTTSSPGEVRFLGAVSGGDSGSPVITGDGRAIGPAVSIAVSATGTVRATRLSAQLPAAESLLGTTLRLQTAPLRSLP